MLYACVKSGVGVNIADLGLNVLIDLVNFSAEIDSAALAAAEGKNIRKTAPMSVAEMTTAGKVRL